MSLKASARLKPKKRSADSWITHSKVLNGSSPAKKSPTFGRNPNFDTDETKLLIQLWGDPKIQRTLITTHKKHTVICQLAAKMQDYGYYRSADEITTRIKNLKCFYNRLKKDLESGQSIEPSWKHFAEMDAIMTRPIFSVRPNEVPAPSLKYQIEKAREENEMRRKRVRKDGDNDDDVVDEEEDDFPGVSDCESESYSEEGGLIVSHQNKSDLEIEMEKGETFNEVDILPISNHENGKDSTSPIKSLKSFTKANDLKSLNDLDLEVTKEIVDKDSKNSKNSPETNNSDDIAVKEEKSESSRDSKASDDQQKENISQNPNVTNANKKEEDAKSKGDMVIPKEEPIDVDDDSNSGQNNTAVKNHKLHMPTLLDMLQLPKSGQSATANDVTITPIPSSSTSTSGSKSLPTISNCSAIAPASSPSTIVANSQAKISLVPTNFLMQPKQGGTGSPVATQQIVLQNQTLSMGQLGSQPRLVLNSDALQCAANTGIVATGPNGMKVLLVNAEQAAAAGLRGSIQVQAPKNLLAPLQPLQTQTQVQSAAKQQTFQQHQQPQQQFQQHVQQQQQQQQQQKKFSQQVSQQRDPERRDTPRSRRSLREERERQRREDLMAKKEITGMRILLRQLINGQHEHNEIEKKRLALERERLEFEKKAVDRLMDSIPPIMQQIQQQFMSHEQQQEKQQQQFFLQQQQQHHQHLQQQQLLNQQMKQPNILTSTGGQIRFANPPKLLFTMPSGSQTITNFAPKQTQSATILTTSASLTTSLPKVTTSIPISNLTTTGIPGVKPIEICTQINDLQLIQPKVECVDE